MLKTCFHGNDAVSRNCRSPANVLNRRTMLVTLGIWKIKKTASPSLGKCQGREQNALDHMWESFKLPVGGAFCWQTKKMTEIPLELKSIQKMNPELKNATVSLCFSILPGFVKCKERMILKGQLMFLLHCKFLRLFHSFACFCVHLTYIPISFALRCR